ncbi:DEAD/DEAH box helicase [Arthrobacter crystallopoietes]|uniref:DEAD/DEAH box helicase n=1 Tax=Crystallibacter crystallopoietes TaxID=37928 RepID=UPI001ABE61E7|nr:DEAD/DEAH box helicase [Arthrobacter crystallopoietes]QTG82407.1 SNF2 helicase associated domain-containing protein [Arthrobacter crystallopoietes]
MRDKMEDVPQLSFPQVDAGEIIRHVGGAAFARGKAYSSGNTVEDLTWDPDTGVLQSRVNGTAAVPYRCRVQLKKKHDGGYSLLDNSCSCPVGYDCKHVAATLLYGNLMNLRASEEFKLSAESTPFAGYGASASPAIPQWQQALDSLLATGPQSTPKRAASSIGRKTRSRLMPLGLQFEVRDQTLQAHQQWRPGSGVSHSGRVPTNRIQLGVRPVVRNDKDRWVRNNLRWNSISFKTFGMSLDPEQHRWFSQFVPLHRASGQLHFGEDNDWLYLDEFSSPLLWQLLDEAKRLGIAMLGAKADTAVIIGRHAELRLDARAPESGLTLEPSLYIDGTPQPLEMAGAIGNHGAYSYDNVLRQITLAPTRKQLTAGEQQLLQRPAAVAVPEQDVPQFLEQVYPRLQRTISVTSSDASVELPEILPPTLVLTATYGKANSLKLEWAFEYGRKESAARKPLEAEPQETGYRDAEAEAELKAAVRKVLHVEHIPAETTVKDMGAVDFTQETIPRLEKIDGVRVDVIGEQPDYRELTETPELTISTVETEQTDWFDLGVMVTVAGRKIPFGDIFKALSKGQKKLLLVDKTYLSLEQPVFDKLRELVDEAMALQDRGSGELQISRYQAGLWAEFEELAEDTEQAQAWQQSVSGLLKLDKVEPTPLPAGLHAELRPYQAEGFNWLAFLWRYRLGGVLADDMGLGKTLQALALMLHAKETATNDVGPFLVVAPTSVVPNWVTEARRFAPGLRVTSITDTQARTRLPLSETVAEADVVITSYTIFRLNAEDYQEQKWAGLILDEAQFVKNRTTKAHQAARHLQTPFKLAITGTPMENNLMELWSIFAITAPGLFPSALKFADTYQRPIERSGSTELLARLRRRIRPLMMRRTKEAVASDLPPKQEQVLEVELSAKHRKIYDTHLQRERQKIMRLVDNMDKNRFTIFQSLTLLRMLSLDASLIHDDYAAVPSSKLDVLFEQLEDVLAEGHRALIFSQFTSFLKKAAERLDVEGVEYTYLDGSTRRRAEVINRFKEGHAPVFLISLKAGGFGLNLTEADYCFLLDPWWNPASEAQAVDRTHRIGQTKNVMVYRMVAKNTIEEKVMALKEGKSKLFSSVMDDDAMFSSKLTADDIRGLLES